MAAAATDEFVGRAAAAGSHHAPCACVCACVRERERESGIRLLKRDHRTMWVQSLKIAASFSPGLVSNSILLFVDDATRSSNR